MKNTILLFSLLIISACSSPVPEVPTLVSDKVINVGQLTAPHKTGPYTVAFHVETEEFYMVSDMRAILGNENQGFSGPGTVNHFVIRTFVPLIKFVKAASPTEMLFYGDLVLDKKGSAYLHKGKKVMYLHHASFGEKQFYIDRASK